MMGNRAAGIFGGVLALLGGGGLFALWWFIIGPYLAEIAAVGALWNLFMIDMVYGMGFLGAPFWGAEIIPGTGITVMFYMYHWLVIASMPLIVNFWGVISLDPLICVIVLVGMIATGGILAIAGAEEG